MKFISIVVLFLMFSSCSKSENISNETSQEDSSAVKEKVQANPKKGACFTTNNSTWSSRVTDLNVSWHYSWGLELQPEEPDSVQFVPMQWGKWNMDQNIEKINSMIKAGKAEYLLTFNEPDGKKQANMTVEEALAYWPKLMALDLKLGSPACVHADNDWMKAFMAKVEENKYRVDFVCVHWYGGANAESLINYLQKIHDLYQRPIWLTEFAPADWNASSPVDSKVTKAKALEFVSQVLPMLDTIPYVHRYSWFSANQQSAALGNSALFDNFGKLTPVGEYYSNFNDNSKYP